MLLVFLLFVFLNKLFSSENHPWSETFFQISDDASNIKAITNKLISFDQRYPYHSFYTFYTRCKNNNYPMVKIFSVLQWYKKFFNIIPSDIVLNIWNNRSCQTFYNNNNNILKIEKTIKDSTVWCHVNNDAIIKYHIGFGISFNHALLFNVEEYYVCKRPEIITNSKGYCFGTVVSFVVKNQANFFRLIPVPRECYACSYFKDHLVCLCYQKRNMKSYLNIYQLQCAPDQNMMLLKKIIQKAEISIHVSEAIYALSSKLILFSFLTNKIVMKYQLTTDYIYGDKEKSDMIKTEYLKAFNYSISPEVQQYLYKSIIKTLKTIIHLKNLIKSY